MDKDFFSYSYDPQIVSTITPPFRKTKQKYDLNTLKGRHDYFQDKAGKLVEALQEFFENHTFIAYWLAPKNAGKSTFIGLLKEIFGKHTFNHISVGDILRDFQKNYTAKKQEYDNYFKQNYRGYIKLEDAIEAVLRPDISTLKPTELVLTLIKKEIDSLPKRILFLDGFPRTEDQISYSLYFRELINYRDDPDIFIMIHLPLAVIDERIKYRRICPNCKRSYNLKLLPTEKIEYDKEKDEFYLVCDDSECNNARLVSKQGDDKGIENIIPRIKKDLKLMEMAENLYGVPKVHMYNALEKQDAFNYVQDYEVTAEYSYTYENGKVVKHTSPWHVVDNGKEYYSLLSSPVLLQLLKQLADIFNITY